MARSWHTSSLKQRGVTPNTMWESNRNEKSLTIATPELAQVAASIPAPRPTVRVEALPGGQTSIGKGLTLLGEISSSEPQESLFIDGSIQGSINLPGCRVTVGRAGHVTASIQAQDIVVMGKVRGNITASNRLDIRAEGSVTGEASAPRVSIEDGAYFKGSLEVRKSVAKPVVAVDHATMALETPTALLAQADVRAMNNHRTLQSA